MTEKSNHKRTCLTKLLSLLVAEAFLCSSILPAWATPLSDHSSTLRTPGVVQEASDGGKTLRDIQDALKQDQPTKHVTIPITSARDAGSNLLSADFSEVLVKEKTRLLNRAIKLHQSNLDPLETESVLLSDQFLRNLEEEGLATDEVREAIAFVKSKEVLRSQDLLYILEEIEREIIEKDPVRSQRVRQFMEGPLLEFLLENENPLYSTDAVTTLLDEARFDPAFHSLLVQLIQSPTLHQFIEALNFLYFIPHGTLLIDDPPNTSVDQRTAGDLLIHDIQEVQVVTVKGERLQRIVIDHPEQIWISSLAVSSSFTNHIIVSRNALRHTAKKREAISRGEKSFELPFEPPVGWTPEGAVAFSEAATSVLRHHPLGTDVESRMHLMERNIWEHEVIHKAIELGLMPYDNLKNRGVDQEFATYPWEFTRPGVHQRLVGLFVLFLNPQQFEMDDYGHIWLDVSGLMAALHESNLLEENFVTSDFQNPLVAARILNAIDRIPESDIARVMRVAIAEHFPEQLALMDEVVVQNGGFPVQDGGTDQTLANRLKQAAKDGGAAGRIGEPRHRNGVTATAIYP